MQLGLPSPAALAAAAAAEEPTHSGRSLVLVQGTLNPVQSLRNASATANNALVSTSKQASGVVDGVGWEVGEAASLFCKQRRQAGRQVVGVKGHTGPLGQELCTTAGQSRLTNNCPRRSAKHSKHKTGAASLPAYAQVSTIGLAEDPPSLTSPHPLAPTQSPTVIITEVGASARSCLCRGACLLRRIALGRWRRTGHSISPTESSYCAESSCCWLWPQRAGSTQETTVILPVMLIFPLA